MLFSGRTFCAPGQCSTVDSYGHIPLRKVIDYWKLSYSKKVGFQKSFHNMLLPQPRLLLLSRMGSTM